MASAASRHHRCAVTLGAANETAEACYLIGLAAECAIKYHLEQVGFNFHAKSNGRRAENRDPIYLHFPDLAVEILAQGSGIVTGRLLAHIGDRSLLNGWSVRMRYAKQLSDKSTAKKYKLWKQQTDLLFSEIGL